MNTVAARLMPAVQAAKRVYVSLGFLAVLIALVGFWPTYFGPMLAARVPEHPNINVIHLHAAVFMGWLLLFIAQGWLAATGRVRLHMRIGRFGMAYGVVVLAVGLLVAFVAFGRRVQTGDLEMAQRILIAPLSDMIVFPAFLGAAWVYRDRPETHKRLIVVATTILLIAAVGRTTMNLFGSSLVRSAQALPAYFYLTFFAIWSAPLVIAMAYDWGKRRIVHPVYLLGLATLVLLLLRQPLATSEAWLAFSGWLATFYQ